MLPDAGIRGHGGESLGQELGQQSTFEL
jgi:hypothetical protein